IVGGLVALLGAGSIQYAGYLPSSSAPQTTSPEIGEGWIVGCDAGEGVELGQERATAIDRRLQGGSRDRPGNGDVLARLVQLLF
ncbi:hypothetical protein ACC723_38400, partial [Rhizobium ruizarguesonis]